LRKPAVQHDLTAVGLLLFSKQQESSWDLVLYPIARTASTKGKKTVEGGGGTSRNGCARDGAQRQCKFFPGANTLFQCRRLTFPSHLLSKEDNATGMRTIDPASRPSRPDVSFVLSVSDVLWSKPPLPHLYRHSKEDKATGMPTPSQYVTFPSTTRIYLF
jgi:hypothetical protein